MRCGGRPMSCGGVCERGWCGWGRAGQQGKMQAARHPGPSCGPHSPRLQSVNALPRLSSPASPTPTHPTLLQTLRAPPPAPRPGGQLASSTASPSASIAASSGAGGARRSMSNGGSAAAAAAGALLGPAGSQGGAGIKAPANTLMRASGAGGSVRGSRQGSASSQGAEAGLRQQVELQVGGGCAAGAVAGGRRGGGGVGVPQRQQVGRQLGRERVRLLGPDRSRGHQGSGSRRGLQLGRRGRVGGGRGRGFRPRPTVHPACDPCRCHAPADRTPSPPWTPNARPCTPDVTRRRR